MFFKAISKAIHKLIELKNVALGKGQQSATEQAAAAFRAGDVDACANALRAAMQEGMSTEAPVRPTQDEIEIINSELSGAPSDPDFNNLTIRIKATGSYINLRQVHVGVENWKYDLDSARLANTNGKALHGKAGNIPETDKAILERLYGPHKLTKGGPAHNIG